MSVEFDTQNYNQNRAPELRTPFMAKKLMKWGWAKSLMQANIYLVIFSIAALGASAMLLLVTHVVAPSALSHSETASVIGSNESN